jgi:hypothetical protein
MWLTRIRLSLGVSKNARARSIPRRPTARPCLETLEDRCLLSLNATTHVAGPNIDVSNLAGYQGETTIAINPTNPANMIAGSNNLGPSSIFGVTEAYWTKDGGNTWTAVALGGQGDPGVAFDRAGNAYFSFIDSNPAGVPTLFVGQTSDTFGPGVAPQANGSRSDAVHATSGLTSFRDKALSSESSSAAAIDRLFADSEDPLSSDALGSEVLSGAVD